MKRMWKNLWTRVRLPQDTSKKFTYSSSAHPLLAWTQSHDRTQSRGAGMYHFVAVDTQPKMGGLLLWEGNGTRAKFLQLSDFTFILHFHALKKEMATHSSVLAWRIPGTEGAWWAAVYGVTQSRTRLKWLSSSSSRRSKCADMLVGVKKIKNAVEYNLHSWKKENMFLIIGILENAHDRRMSEKHRSNNSVNSFKTVDRHRS